MTESKWPRTKNRVTDHDLVLVSPKTGMILQISRPTVVPMVGTEERHYFDQNTKIMQEIVDHMNKTMGLDQ